MVLLKGQSCENRKDYLVHPALFSDLQWNKNLHYKNKMCREFLFTEFFYVFLRIPVPKKMSGVNKDYYLTDNGLCEDNGYKRMFMQYLDFQIYFVQLDVSTLIDSGENEIQLL